ncbi:hypothetical protein SUGI_0703240 [Cryptomeria japonica]|nr:hypothetical protein SUGI_0703240 [Cryptomeria japonica]
MCQQRLTGRKIDRTTLQVVNIIQNCFVDPFKKQSFEKNVAESSDRMQAQRIQHDVMNHLSGQMNFAEKVPNNRNNIDYLLKLNLIKSCILETEDGPTEKVGESQTRHQGQLKTPLRGKAKEKAVEVAKKKTFVQWNDKENRNNTGNLLDLNWINSYILEIEDGCIKRVEGRKDTKNSLRVKTSLRGNPEEKAMKVAKKMAIVQCWKETLNSKRGITTVN